MKIKSRIEYTLAVLFFVVNVALLSMGGAAAAEKYKEDFLHIWCNMTDDERTEYANYKSYVDVLNQQEKAIKAEGLKELNN